MRLTHNVVRASALVYVFFISTACFAGGPLVIEGSSGNTPVSYPGGNVSLNFDKGLLLNNRTNQQVDDLVLQAFSLWNNVSTATVQISQSTDLSQNIDVSNYANLLPNGNTNDPSFSDNINPIIYDNDGQIIDDYLGANQSDDVAGFAASIFFVGGNEFVEGYAVLNGATTPALNDSDVVTLVAHEIGHLIGLDHSQLDIDNSETSGNACNTAASRDDYPMMYPFLCRVSLDLHPDDVAAVSALYPANSIDAQFGQLQGHFVDTSDNAILGANLWVENTSTGDTYSIVSDYLKQNNGFFSLRLPPGNYTLHANSINPIFTGASSVGPYALNAGGASFQSPHPITAVTYMRDTASPIALAVSLGLSTNVEFVIDGTGTDTAGNPITNPNTSLTGSSSGGGIVHFYLLGIMLIGGGLRRLTRR